MFFYDTNCTTKLTSSFNETNSCAQNANTFYKRFKRFMHRNFKKIRIKTGGNRTKLGSTEIQERLERKTELMRFIKNNLCIRGKQRALEELEEVEQYLIERSADKNANIIKKHVRSMENEEGNFNQLKL